MKIWRWFKTLLSRKPHFVIGDPAAPYMLRWYLIPRNPWLNIYLHKFMRSDDDRALHDHPWWFASFMLKGSYIEHVELFQLQDQNKRWASFTKVTQRDAGSFAYRAAEHQHRVELLNDGEGNPVPCWTLVITGAKSRDWGFWCPKGFTPWQEFCARDNHGSVGKGCGE